MLAIKEISDYYQISDRLATSGQPSPEQFTVISEAGYQIIVNLAMSNSTNALVNEGEIVTDLGMTYLQIPVVWEHPTLDDLNLFFKAMQSFAEYQVWVHCAKNMRVSCFIYLWQKHILKLPETEARYPMNQIWQPTGVWQQLIDQAANTF